MLARRAGGARFAHSACLAMVKDALTARRADPDVAVPWSGFDLINLFHGFKTSPAAGIDEQGAPGLP